jgi:hypothetical protein
MWFVGGAVLAARGVCPKASSTTNPHSGAKPRTFATASGVETHVEPTPSTLCGASNRDGQPCGRRPALGKRRCHFHGGTPGTGGRPDNGNALKHGFYSARVREFAADILVAAKQPLELGGEIALLRAVLARAAGTAQPQTLVPIVSTLARLINAQHKLPYLPPPMSDDDYDRLEEIAAAINEVLQREGEDWSIDPPGLVHGVVPQKNTFPPSGPDGEP